MKIDEPLAKRLSCLTGSIRHPEFKGWIPAGITITELLQEAEMSVKLHLMQITSGYSYTLFKRCIAIIR